MRMNIIMWSNGVGSTVIKHATTVLIEWKRAFNVIGTWGTCSIW